MLVEENLELNLEANSGWDPRIHCAKCGDLVRAYIIVCSRFTLVYDTLLGPKSGSWLRDTALKLAQGLPLIVVNSHSDWDHFFGNSSFTEPIIASRLCAQRISGSVGAKELSLKIGESPESYSGLSLLAPSISFEGGATLEGGDLTLKLLPTPGHRPDHLAIFIPEISTLFPGDCVENPIPLVDEDSKEGSNTIKELIASLEMMRALTPSWVLANHAQPQSGTQQIELNLSYLHRLEAEALKAESLEQLKLAFRAQPQWPQFYQKAHQNQLGMAWQQR